MAEVHDQLAEAFRELRDAFGVSVTFGTTTVSAVVNESTLARELERGGFQAVADVELHVLLADLPAVPELGSQATYKGEPWTVGEVSVQPGHLVAKFGLKPVRR